MTKKTIKYLQLAIAGLFFGYLLGGFYVEILKPPAETPSLKEQVENIKKRHSVLKKAKIIFVEDGDERLSDGATATTNLETMETYINKKSEVPLEHLIYHESGHYLWFDVSNRFHEKFCEAWEARDHHSVSWYGETDCEESFAEFVAYELGSDYGMFEDNFPEEIEEMTQYQMVNKLLQKRFD